jgi:hypothetical protein
LLQSYTGIALHAATREETSSLLHFHYLVAVAVKDYTVIEQDLWPRLPSGTAPGAAPFSYVYLQRAGLEHNCMHGTHAIQSKCVTPTRCVGSGDSADGDDADGTDGADGADGVDGADGGGGVRCLPMLSTKAGFTDPTTYKLGWQFTMLAPVVGGGSGGMSGSNGGRFGGWVVLGELNKYVPVATNRFAAIGTRPTNDSNSVLDLVVELRGASREVVLVTLIAPDGMVLVATATIGLDGAAVLSCSAARASCALTF